MPIEEESPEEFGYDLIECNLSESSVTDGKIADVKLGDLSSLVLCYGDHKGLPKLRELIAKEADISGGSLTSNDVLATTGAAGALFIIATSILRKGDHMIVVKPNYATNIETPRTIGCNVSFYELQFDEGWKFNIDSLKQLLTPVTKLISITTPHNPTGVVIAPEQIKEIVKVMREISPQCKLLVDETYHGMRVNEGVVPPSAAILGSDVIAVSSMSKTYGLPGVRIGWIICTDKVLMKTFLAAKEQIFVCGSVIDEEIAYQALINQKELLKPIIELSNDNFATLKEWMSNNPFIEWIEPQGGVVCFPRIKNSINVDIEKFYQVLKDKYKTYVGPGHWFEMNKRYMRIGYGWPTRDAFKKGLESIVKAVEESLIQ
jgi:aspartate/methionine/tyrosine aminotransferase